MMHLAHREHINTPVVIPKSYTPFMKGNKGSLWTISLNTYTKDNLGTHCRIQIIKDRATHSMEDSKHRPILCTVSTFKIHMANTGNESTHSSNRQNSFPKLW